MSGFGSAVILAGGRSTRMGFDKQMLMMDDRRLVRHLIALLQTCFDDIMVASSSPRLYAEDQVRVIADIYEGIGPLGGIHAALVNAKNEAVFTIACDMPFIEIPYIKYMISRMEEGNYDACLTCRGDHLEVFHAFYCQSGLPVLEDDLARGKHSVYRFARKINTLIISEKEAAPFLPGWQAFTNLNTPEEYAEFARRMTI